jgi:type IV pilus assembly protein PilW
MHTMIFKKGSGASMTRRVIAREGGLSLVELMISITIGLVILAAMVALFVNTSRSNREMARANNVIENGRLAIQLLEADLVHAGFWGAYVPQFDDQTGDVIPTDTPTAAPNPCAAYNPGLWNAVYQTNLLGIPVQVYDSAATCGAVVLDKRAATDVLVVRHAETCIPGEGGNCPADVAGRLYFQSTQCSTELGSGVPTPHILSDDPADFLGLHKRDCITVADKRRFISNIYYISDSVDADGNVTPTLMRSQFDLDGTLAFQPPQAMIEGVEGFRVELGVDSLSETGGAVNYGAAIVWADPDTRTTPTNRGDGVADGNFVTCTTGTPCTAAQLSNVAAVKLYVLVRSRDESRGYTDTKSYMLAGATVGPFNDHFKRHVFVTTVRLPNITGRRVTP